MSRRSERRGRWPHRCSGSTGARLATTATLLADAWLTKGTNSLLHCNLNLSCHRSSAVTIQRSAADSPPGLTAAGPAAAPALHGTGVHCAWRCGGRCTDGCLSLSCTAADAARLRMAAAARRRLDGRAWRPTAQRRGRTTVSDSGSEARSPHCTALQSSIPSSLPSRRPVRTAAHWLCATGTALLDRRIIAPAQRPTPVGRTGGECGSLSASRAQRSAVSECSQSASHSSAPV